MYEWIAKVTGDERMLQRIARFTGRVPPGIMVAVCRAAALLLYMFGGVRLRQRILSNMLELLPDRKVRDLKSVRYRYYENVVFALYEIAIESYRLPAGGTGRFRVEGEACLEEALRLGRGAIVYTPHCGNFFYYYWYLCQKYDCLTVATAGSEELRPFYLKFQALGCPGLDYDRTPSLELLRKLKKHLHNGGIVFLLGDFWRPTFPPSRFFGKQTRTPQGASTLAIEQQAPLVPFYGRRDRGFVHRLTFEPALHLSSSFSRSTRSEATRLLNRFMERVIREHPAQWFYWFNAQERWEQECRTEAEQDAGKETHSA